MAKQKKKQTPAKLAKGAEKVMVEQASKGLTADVTYRKKKGKPPVVVRNVGAVGIRGDKIFVQDQTKPDAKVKSFLRSNLITAAPSEEKFDDEGFNEFKDDEKPKRKRKA